MNNCLLKCFVERYYHWGKTTLWGITVLNLRRENGKTTRYMWLTFLEKDKTSINMDFFPFDHITSSDNVMMFYSYGFFLRGEGRTSRSSNVVFSLLCTFRTVMWCTGNVGFTLECICVKEMPRTKTSLCRSLTSTVFSDLMCYGIEWLLCNRFTSDWKYEK